MGEYKHPALQAQELSEALMKTKGPKHECAPKEWRETPIVAGDYDFDETLRHRDNADLPHRLEQHLRGAGYHRRTGYTGYRGTDD